MLNGKTILLGVCGGIAAYKAAALCSRLTQAGANVRVIMTASAVKFVAPLTFQTLSRHEVYTDTFDERDASVVSHIELADSADLVVVAPATANLLAKMAHGQADDMLSTTLLATTAPIFVAPAMNVHMYAHPAVQHNMQTLRERGTLFIEPGEGQLACGYVGKGRLAEPEDIARTIEGFLQGRDRLKGKKVLVTAGGTIERIDPVRYLTNDSTGKMGIAVAEAALRMGAEVTLICGKISVRPPEAARIIHVASANDMLQAVKQELPEVDIVVKTAAVADYRPETAAEQKIKKTEDTITLKLVKNPDILQYIGEAKTRQFVVGFAAETEHVAERAIDKARRKRCDLVVANDVTKPGAGFGADTNIVDIYDQNGLVLELPQLPKAEVAARLLELAAARLGDRV